MPAVKMALDPKIWSMAFCSPLFNRVNKMLAEVCNANIGFWGIEPSLAERLKDILGSESIPERGPEFCKLIYATEIGRQRCRTDSKRCLDRILSTLENQCFTCHAGLTEIAVPIIFRGQYCGCMSNKGGWLLHEPTETHWEEILRRTQDLGVDRERLKEAYFKLRPISKEMLDMVIRLLSILTEEIVNIAAEVEQDKRRLAMLEEAMYTRFRFESIVGKSQAMQDVFKLMARMADSQSPVLIEGETGTGKELLANVIHHNSPRKGGPFVPINCGGLTETLLDSELFGHVKGSFTGALRDKKGLFEAADEGTIFLDEIAEMSGALQVKLLRVLQEGTLLPVGSTQPRRVDVRIISATNKEIKRLVASGAFREDLYYRLNVIRIWLPPLRERKEDIPLLVEHFIDRAKVDPKLKHKEVLGVSRDAMRYLLDYSWPGNVRELQNVMERAIVLASSKYITVEDLPEEIVKGVQSLGIHIDTSNSYEQSKRSAMEAFQKGYITKVLKETKGNIAMAARRSRMSREALYQLLKRYDLHPSDFKV